MNRSKRNAFTATLALLLSFNAPWAVAADPLPPDPEEDRIMRSAGFFSSHPDLRYRLLGLEELKQGRHEDALKFFTRAGFYADKPSQGMVAEMYWTGQGTQVDPVLGYIWMDLAAERGYEGFVILRERYWKALDADQRARAVAEGQALYAKYGDAAAQPRLDAVLRRGRSRVTGSRVGATGTLQILVPGPGGYESIDGSHFYHERFWDPKQYRAWHDAIWKKPRVGRVTVGELENANEVPSRIPETTPQTDAVEPDTPERDETGLGTARDD